MSQTSHRPELESFSLTTRWKNRGATTLRTWLRERKGHGQVLKLRLSPGANLGSVFTMVNSSLHGNQYSCRVLSHWLFRVVLWSKWNKSTTMVATLWGGNNSWLNMIGRPTISLSHGAMDTHILFWRVFNVVLVQTLGQIDSVILKIKGLVNQMDEGLGGQRRQALFIAFGMYLMISVELFFKAKLHCTSHKQQLYTYHWVVIPCSGYWRLREQSLLPEGRKRRTVTVATSPTTISASSSVVMVACSGKPNGVKRGWKYRSKELFLFYMVYHRWSAKCTSITCFLLWYMIRYAYHEIKVFFPVNTQGPTHTTQSCSWNLNIWQIYVHPFLDC